MPDRLHISGTIVTGPFRGHQTIWVSGSIVYLPRYSCSHNSFGGGGGGEICGGSDSYSGRKRGVSKTRARKALYFFISLLYIPKHKGMEIMVTSKVLV